MDPVSVPANLKFVALPIPENNQNACSILCRTLMSPHTWLVSDYLAQLRKSTLILLPRNAGQSMVMPQYIIRLSNI